MDFNRKSALLFSAKVLLFLKSCRATGGPETISPDIQASQEAPAELKGDGSQAGFVYGAVNEPVIVLWSSPGLNRDYDRLILNKPVNPSVWAAGMDTEMRLWLVGKAETQAVFGEPVVILERQGDWIKVAATKQKTSLSEYGYPGWVPAGHIVTNQIYLTELENLPNAVAAKPVIKLYQNKELTGASVEICYQTRLPILGECEKYVSVRLPDGNTGYLSSQDIKRARELSFSRDEIINEAKSFLGVRYIWAGTASYGFDCSGFTMRLYQSQGVTISRDADEQAKEGVAVAKIELLPGDLIFFAAKGGQGQIHHVGLYAGEGMMIHSPSSSSSVRLDGIDSGMYHVEYWGAKRYVPALPA
ncbi:MAG: Gamma-D-glutamyl-L-lysine endopeptidase [Pelotomaculum sp. PtaB.Bin104]|nr:MAG: Gamma-D-glutamyl-L-lysine endopeptidase [Pelotomaculum sp. PtaB.Bin104]